ncbi:MAG: iron-sulfur cluster assembly accessory protein [Chromatiales bacterium]|jgi:iron-sulfur cluster assembly protein
MSTTATQSARRIESIPAAEHIRVTDRAGAHIKREMAKETGAVGFRVAVRKTGCSGWMYTVEFVHQPDADDLVFPADPDLDIYVDPKSFELIRGTEIDFVHEGLTRQLKFNNPNVTSECGCGESFSIA